MALNLDARQRAMLEEMHVRVWWPTDEPEAEAGPAAQDFSPNQVAASAAPGTVAASAGSAVAGAARAAGAKPSPAAAPSAQHGARPAVPTAAGSEAVASAAAPWPRPDAASTAPTAPTAPNAPNAPNAPAMLRSTPHGVPAHAPQPQGQQATEAAEAAAAGWSALVPRVAECQACGLCAGRHAPVLRPAVLPAQRDWMVVGEPPNEDEERAGEAFAADAGKLLDNMLRAVGVSRRAEGVQGAWATNVVKCRPAIARIPHNDELLQCRAHLDAEIALVRPRVILAMGRFATLSLLGPANPALSGRPFGQLRGSVHSHAGVPVVVMQHPERLLRQPAQKAEAWADLCRAMEIVRGG